MACIACGRGFHEECEEGCEACHDTNEVLSNAVQALTYGAPPSGTPTGNVGRPQLSDDKVTDRYSTGRKRAALLYPLYLDQPCEWRGLKNVGGGIPIVGCLNGFQQDRHHGPIKDPLHNEEGNVHRICKKCHKRWHYFNDPSYNEADWSKTNHNPATATEDELRTFELKWIRTPKSDFTFEDQ